MSIVVEISDSQGKFIAKRTVNDFDPMFILDVNDSDFELEERRIWLYNEETSERSLGYKYNKRVRTKGVVSQIKRGGKIKLPSENKQRNIVAVTFDAMTGIEILAPQQIQRCTGKENYLKSYCVDDTERSIELRPGTQVLGGRGSGFYDNYGIILHAEFTGGAQEKWEDWAYYVMIRQLISDDLTAFWVLVDGIQGAISEPKEITRFPTQENVNLDNLLKRGESELFEYFIKNPQKIDALHPKQFQELVSAIYKNLGFNVEQVGAWNQADGGIDIIAVSKSFAGFEYKLAIQCKVSKNKISATPIRELAGVINGREIHQGVVATTSRFTKPAISEQKGHFWNIELLDKEAIVNKMIRLILEDDRSYY